MPPSLPLPSLTPGNAVLLDHSTKVEIETALQTTDPFPFFQLVVNF
jgi:hypothetical protein